jgi:2-phospho-L-lactate guanylyltransferase
MWALVPAKCFHRAKSRLRLPVRARIRLARRFLEHVLATAAPLVDGILVVTDCPSVARHARSRGAHTLIRPPARTLADTIDEGLRVLGTPALVLMSDLPKLRGDDLRRMLARPEAIVAAPDLVERGTNALLVRERVATRFGREDSFAAHLQLGAAIFRAKGIGFDVDARSDLAHL